MQLQKNQYPGRSWRLTQQRSLTWSLKSSIKYCRMVICWLDTFWTDLNAGYYWNWTNVDTFQQTRCHVINKYQTSRKKCENPNNFVKYPIWLASNSTVYWSNRHFSKQAVMNLANKQGNVWELKQLTKIPQLDNKKSKVSHWN